MEQIGYKCTKRLHLCDLGLQQLDSCLARATLRRRHPSPWQAKVANFEVPKSSHDPPTCFFSSSVVGPPSSLNSRLHILCKHPTAKNSTLHAQSLSSAGPLRYSVGGIIQMNVGSRSPLHHGNDQWHLIFRICFHWPTCHRRTDPCNAGTEQPFKLFPLELLRALRSR